MTPSCCLNRPTPLWGLVGHVTSFRFIPHRQFCLQNGHLELSIPWRGSTKQPRVLLFKNSPRAPAILRETSEGTATRRQTNDLHVSIAAGLHQSFLWLRPLRHSSPSFGSRQVCSHSNPSQKIRVGRRCNPQGDPPISFLAPYGFTCPLTRTHVRLLGPCFKTGRMGSPQADARSTQVPKHTETARASNHNRDDDVSTSMSTAGLGPPSQFASVHARVDWRTGSRRSTSDRGTSPAPSASLRQFQALFDSLFKVLFIFPSRYLFAIGLSPVFSLGRNLPPIGAAFPNNPTRRQRSWCDRVRARRGSHPLRRPFQGTWARSATEDASPDYNSDTEGVRFSWWAFPGSLAVTKGILEANRPHGSKSRKAGGGNTHDRSRALTQPPSITAPSTADSHVAKARGQRCATPRQACPRPNGFGRNLRSKTRWFTGFCNSHKYRISLRSSSMQEPRYPLPRVFRISVSQRRPHEHRLRADGGELNDFNFLGAFGAGVLLLGQEETAQGSVDFSQRRRQRTAHVAAIRTLHRTIQSVGATGGVYKGQGRSQRELMTRAY
ncbi:hypothetical protein Lal_00049252 [Lupinus albus]|nr:hypothetical protein Lal_00049252 [Lupinus albus]